MNITTNQSFAFVATKIPQQRRITQKNMETITRVRDLVEYNKMYKEADMKKSICIICDRQERMKNSV